jgi:hypothetical protein
MKELLQKVFQAGTDFGHAMGIGRPTKGLKFDEWYSENEHKLKTHNEILQSEQIKNFLIWLEKEGYNCDFEWDDSTIEDYLKTTKLIIKK